MKKTYMVFLGTLIVFSMTTCTGRQPTVVDAMIQSEDDLTFPLGNAQGNSGIHAAPPA
jgi:hypothetical protein